jgi:hypothetical protein
MKNSILTLSILLSFCTSIFSQDKECGTEFRKDTEEKQTELVEDNGRRFIVPVFFHVLHNNIDENVSDRNILGALETLQKDFLVTNEDIVDVPEEFKNKLGKPNIRFVLADTLPTGERTTGIRRTFTSTLEFNLKKNKMFEESPIIDPTRYLNVYICDVNTNGYYPNKLDPKLDGVVIDYQVAKQKYRTLTHETGHWLDLCHIFGCKGGNCGDDKVSDTPKQRKHSSCSRPKYPKEECSPKASVMFMNFMDYGEARYFFTEGQVVKMRQYVLKKKPLLRTEPT